jgi:hypothetical protein
VALARVLLVAAWPHVRAVSLLQIRASLQRLIGNMRSPHAC